MYPILLLFLLQAESAPAKSIITDSGVVPVDAKMSLGRGMRWVAGGDFGKFHQNKFQLKDFCDKAEGKPDFSACFQFGEQGYTLGDEVPVLRGHCSDRRRAGYGHVFLSVDRSISAVGEDLGDGWMRLLAAKLPANRFNGKRLCMSIPRVSGTAMFRPVVYSAEAKLTSSSHGGKPEVKQASVQAQAIVALPNGAIDGVLISKHR